MMQPILPTSQPSLRARIARAFGLNCLRRTVLALLWITGPGFTARAEPNHPALRELMPLIEVFAAEKTVPAFDVAGLRCAGLLLAQHDWASRNQDVDAPTEADMRRADQMLEASEQQRLNDGMDLVRAHVSIEREAKRVWKLYERRFKKNANAGAHPWRDDPLVTGDTRFCALLLG